MKKILHLVSLFFILLTPYSFAEEANDCIDVSTFGSKIGNWDISDVQNDTGYKPCGRFLLPNDPLAKTMLYYIGNKDSVIELEEDITKLGGDYGLFVNDLREENSFLVIFTLLLSVAFMSALFYAGTRATKVFRESNSSNQAAKSSVVLLVMGAGYYLMTNLPLYISKGIIFFTSSYNYLIYNFHDFDSLDTTTDPNTKIEKYSEAYDVQNSEMAEALQLVEITNVITDNSIREELYGKSDLVIEGVGVWGDVNRNPTIEDYLLYQNECSSMDKTLVESESYYSLRNLFSFSSELDTKNNIPTGVFLKNAGDTVEYECPSDDFGKHNTVTLEIRQETHEIIENFLAEQYSGDLTKDQTGLIDDIAQTLDNTLGLIRQDLENAAVVASSNPSSVESEIELALSAVIESRTSGIDIQDTSSFITLKDQIATESAGAFQLNVQEDIDVKDYLILEVSKIIVYKFSKLFGFQETVDPITDEGINGYYYLEPFIKQTARTALDLSCANRHGAYFAQRSKFAQEFNLQDLTKPNKTANQFTEVGDYECYEYTPSTNQLKALGNPNEVETLKQEVKDRVRAVKTLLDAYDIGMITNIVSRAEMYDHLKLEFLNEIKMNMHSAIKSSYTFLEEENLLNQALNAVNQSMNYNYKIETITDQTVTFFNYERFLNSTLDQTQKKIIDDKRKLRKYDLDYMFDITLGNTIYENDGNKAEADTGDFLDLIGIDGLSLTDCPVTDSTGACSSSLQQLNYKSLSHLVPQLSTALIAYVGIKAFNGICGNGGDSKNKSLIAGAAKVFGPIKIACAVVEIADKISWLLVFIIAILFMLTLFAFLAAYLPLFIDAFLFMTIIIYVIIPLIMLPIVFSIEAVKASVIYILFKEEKTNDRFKMTITVLKGLLFRPFILLSMLSVFMFIQTSPYLGGAIYDILEDVGVWYIILQPVMVAIFAWLAIKGVKIAITVESEMIKLLGISGKPFFESSDTFVKVALGFIGGAFYRNVEYKVKELGDSAAQYGRNQNAKRNKEKEKDPKDNNENQENSEDRMTRIGTDNKQDEDE